MPRFLDFLSTVLLFLLLTGAGLGFALWITDGDRSCMNCDPE